MAVSYPYSGCCITSTRKLSSSKTVNPVQNISYLEQIYSFTSAFEELIRMQNKSNL